jgi:hypothetical protein
MEILIGLIFIVFAMALDFAVSYGLIYVVCWCFGLMAYFNIKIVLGVWVVMMLLRSIFKTRKD